MLVTKQYKFLMNILYLEQNKTYSKHLTYAKMESSFGIFWVPEEAYGINSNMTFGYKRYFDEDKTNGSHKRFSNSRW